MSFIEAFRLGVTAGCFLASGLALYVACNVRRDAVSRARRVAAATVQRQVFPRICGLERHQHHHEQRLDLIEEVEVHRSRLRVAEGTGRDPAPATAG